MFSAAKLAFPTPPKRRSGSTIYRWATLCSPKNKKKKENFTLKGQYPEIFKKMFFHDRFPWLFDLRLLKNLIHLKWQCDEIFKRKFFHDRIPWLFALRLTFFQLIAWFLISFKDTNILNFKKSLSRDFHKYFFHDQFQQCPRLFDLIFLFLNMADILSTNSMVAFGFRPSTAATKYFQVFQSSFWYPSHKFAIPCRGKTSCDDIFCDTDTNWLLMQKIRWMKLDKE